MTLWGSFDKPLKFNLYQPVLLHLSQNLQRFCSIMLLLEGQFQFGVTIYVYLNVQTKQPTDLCFSDVQKNDGVFFCFSGVVFFTFSSVLLPFVLNIKHSLLQCRALTAYTLTEYVYSPSISFAKCRTLSRTTWKNSP